LFVKLQNVLKIFGYLSFLHKLDDILFFLNRLANTDFESFNRFSFKFNIAKSIFNLIVDAIEFQFLKIFA